SRDLRSSRRGSRGAQGLDQTQELRTQILASQLLGEARSLFARRAVAQPLQALLVTFADFIGRRSHLCFCGRRGRTRGLARSLRVRRCASRDLRSSRRGSRGAQGLDQTQELRTQILASQLLGEARSLFARRAVAQPLQALLVTFADFIGRRSHLCFCGRRGRTRGLARSLRVRRCASRDLRSSRRGSRGAQGLDQTQELRTQILASQLLGEARSLFARRAVAQPLQALLVTFADFIGRRSHLCFC